jgi:hypothetical protein
LRADGRPPKRSFLSSPEQALDRIDAAAAPGVNFYVGIATRVRESGTALDLGQTNVLWVDVDYKDILASDFEARLAKFPFAPSMRVESGGGAHLYWLLDQPYSVATSSARDVLTSVLKAIAHVLGGDFKACDPPRILRVPGTTNYPDAKKRAAGRTAKRSTLAYANPSLSYPFDKFSEFSRSHAVGATTLTEHSAFELPLSVSKALEKNARLKARLLRRDSADLKDASQSGVDFSIASMLSRLGVRPDEIEVAIRWSWAQHRLKAKQPGYLQRTIEKASAPDAVPNLEKPRARPLLIRGRDVEIARLEWLWPGYLPLAKASELVADPNLGKSMIALDLCARLSSGSAWPDGVANATGARSVLYMSGEDAVEDTLLPRFLAAGGVVDRVSFLSEVDEAGKPRPLTLKDLDALEEAITEVEPALVVVDVLNAFLGGDIQAVDAAKVRGRLKGFTDAAARHACTVLWIRHQRKAETEKVVHRASGIQDITALTRNSLILAADPYDRNTRYLAQVKSNLAAAAATLRYRIEPCADLDEKLKGAKVKSRPEGIGVVRWTGTDERTAQQLMSEGVGGRPAEKRSEAEMLLSVLLADGPKPASVVFAAAREQGISETTVRRAADKMYVKRTDAGRRSMWELPSSP